MRELLKSVVRATVPREIRNWLRSPSKSAEWLLDCARYSLGATHSVDLPSNVRLICHPYAYKIYHYAQVNDPEQREEYCSFVSNCRKGMLLFDIGAHFGVFSLTAARLGGNAVAVDPSSISCNMIARQARLNGCTDEIRILQAAVSDAAGAIGMLSSGVFTAGYCKVATGRRPSELTETRAVTVDDLSRQFGRPTHVKIDVEGYEAAVLRGATSTLREFAPLLFLELHNDMIRAAAGDPETILTELEALNYKTYDTSGRMVDKATIISRPIVRIVARKLQ